MSLRFKLLSSLENVVEENVAAQKERFFKWECVLVRFLDLESEENWKCPVGILFPANYGTNT